MRRRRKSKTKETTSAAPPPQSELVHQPFRGLRAKRPTAPPPPLPPSVEEPPPPDDDRALFAEAMTGVRRLAEAGGAALPPPPRELRRRVVEEPDAEALAELSDLVSGEGTFDITDTTEFLEGAVAGVDHGLVRRLRRGDYSFRRHLDLHGMTVAEARAAVGDFFRAALRDGERCVLLVHGRGLNSPDRLPVLKKNLVDWLSRGPWARSILAFTSARPCDGGAGAMYVLLRRQRTTKKQIRVTEGAKW